MRRFYLIFMLLTALFLTSCVHEWPQPSEAEVVLHLDFAGEMPQGPEFNTKSSDGAGLYDVRYVIEAYKERNGGYYSEESPNARFCFTKDDVSEIDHSVTIKVMEGKYKFTVWTDYVAAGTDAHHFYNTDDFSYVKLFGKEEGIAHTGNNDYRDAFVGSVETEVVRFGGNHAPVSAVVEMNRPVSKVVFITNDVNEWKDKVLMNLREMAAQNAKPGEVVKSPEDFDTDNYTVKIHYPQYMPCAFNIHKDRIAWSETTVSFESKLLQLNENEAVMGYDYVFANSEDAKVVMAVTLHDESGTVVSRSSDLLIPLERGKVTIVRGSFLMQDADGGVSIDPDFDGNFNIVL